MKITIKDVAKGYVCFISCALAVVLSAHIIGTTTTMLGLPGIVIVNIAYGFAYYAISLFYLLIVYFLLGAVNSLRPDSSYYALALVLGLAEGVISLVSAPFIIGSEWLTFLLNNSSFRLLVPPLIISASFAVFKIVIFRKP